MKPAPKLFAEFVRRIAMEVCYRQVIDTACTDRRFVLVEGCPACGAEFREKKRQEVPEEV